MKPEKAVSSIEGAAMNRALEYFRPARERLLDDSLAYQLLSPRSRRLVRLMRTPAGGLIITLRERSVPGIIGLIICRARYMDEALQAAISQGMGQAVILGAGLDSRAYRLPGIEKMHVFEIDHPAAQAVKRERLQNLFGALPAHVSFVAIDFDHQTLEQVMETHRFQFEAQTFFIWEGVTQYISQAAVDSTLGFVARCATGSQVAFTYIKRQVIESTSGSAADRRMVSLTRRFGVPWITGFDPSELGAYLAERHLELIEQVGQDELAERYLRPLGRTETIYHAERIALARVMG